MAPKQKQPEPAPRPRRSVHQRIADLEAKISAIKEREARKQAKADPALRLASVALRSVEKASGVARDARTRKHLEQARSALAACLGVAGDTTVVPAPPPRADGDLADALLAYVRANPGSRGEQIAAAMGTDTGTIRPVMKKFIAAGQVTTEGQRRGMTYSAT